MLSEDSTTKDLADIEESILAWLESYDLAFKVSSLTQLTDGRVFLKILQQLPQFTLIRQVFDKAEPTLQDRIRNMKAILESIKKHLQTKLLKDISGLPNISLAELCAGSKRQTIKFVEIVVGTLVASEVKKVFLSRIMDLPIQHQEVFMILLKNALSMMPEEERLSSSPSRARTLLQRIDELEEQLHDTQTELAITKSHLKESEHNITLLKEELNSVRKENSSLAEENQQLKARPETERDTARQLEKNILQQRLESQKNGYEKRIRCLEMALAQADGQVEQLKTAIKDNRQLQRNCESASKRLANLEESLVLNFNTMKQKDETINILREKHRRDQERILQLEGEIDELHEKSMMNLPVRTTKISDDTIDMPSTYRDRSNIGRQMAEVVQNITAQNSRIITQMTKQQLQKQQQYETIILKQREKIKLLEKQIFKRQKTLESKENDFLQINSTGKKPNFRHYERNTYELSKLSQGLNNHHREQIQVLLSVMMEVKAENERLREMIQREAIYKEGRRSLFLGRLNMMFHC